MRKIVPQPRSSMDFQHQKLRGASWVAIFIFWNLMETESTQSKLIGNYLPLNPYPPSLSTLDLSRSGKISLKSIEISQKLVDIQQHTHLCYFVCFVRNRLNSWFVVVGQVYFCSIGSGRVGYGLNPNPIHLWKDLIMGPQRWPFTL